MNRIRPFIIVALLLGVFIAECFGAWSDSQTIDEGTHLVSGISYWKTGEVTLNPEHPPLVKLLAAAPLLATNIQLPFHDQSWTQQDQWNFARRVLYHTTIPPEKLLLLGRIPIILLFLALALTVERSATRIFGPRVGFFVFAFFLVDPTLLAHGRLITTDVGLGLFFFLSCLSFLRVIEKPTKKRFLIFSLCFAAAQLTKFSAIILWFVLPALGLLALMHPITQRTKPVLTLRRWLAGLGLLVLITGFFGWMLYGFQIQPAMHIQAVQEFYSAASSENPQASGNPVLAIPFWSKTLSPDQEPGQTIYQLAKDVPIPALPYFQGLIDLALHNYYGHGTYLLGQTSNMGWWYYFPVAFFLKTPAIIVILGFATLIVLALHQRRTTTERFYWRSRLTQWWQRSSFQSIALVTPPLVYLAWSMTSHINLGVRHLLPIFPFIYLGLGHLFRHPFFTKRLGLAILSVLLLGSWVRAALVYPNELAFFSEFVGGSRQGPRYLLDSNFDWGQGFRELKRYLDERKPDRVYGVFFTSIDLAGFGIHYEHLPTTQEILTAGLPKGTVAISGGVLFDPNSYSDYGWLRQFQPTTKIRDSIYIFDF